MNEGPVRFEKASSYYDSRRTRLMELLPSLRGRFLEVGCGAGATLEYIKSQGASYVAGIDANREAISVAARRGLDLALAIDVEEGSLPFREREFDCIICADVLEHLIDPWGTLKNLARYVRDDGCLLLSIPNVKNYQILLRLVLRDEWTYHETGILDSTHLRFFTLREIRRLLDHAGLRIADLRWHAVHGRRFSILNWLALNRLWSFAVVQYYVRAAKK